MPTDVTPYVAEEIRAGHPEKDPQRRAVADYLLKHDAGDCNRLFSTPSARWSFERLLCGRRRYSVVGVERSATAFAAAFAAAGRLAVAGTGPSPWRALKSMRIAAPDEGADFDAACGRRAALFRADASRFVAAVAAAAEPGRSVAAADWWRQYADWTAVWLDLMCPACDELDRILDRLSAGVRPGREQVPVVVTVLKARERTATWRRIDRAFGGDRAKYVAGRLNAATATAHCYVPDNVVEHKSASNRSTLVTVYGRLVRPGCLR